MKKRSRNAIEPTYTSYNPATPAMARAVRSIKTLKKSWDSDKALKSTYTGKFGKYQLRAYLFLALGYAVTVSWLNGMPTFALLPPKNLNCTPIWSNETTNDTFYTSITTLPTTTELLSTPSNNMSTTSGIPSKPARIEKPTYYYSDEYGRTVYNDFDLMCNDMRARVPYIVFVVGLILGGLIFGYIADHSGRKMVLLGALWTACILSIFQVLSDEYISYVFFIVFVGIAIGAVQVITVPYVVEMFPIESRAIYGLLLTAFVFLLDLVLPWLAFAIKNWKVLQAVVTIPLIVTAYLFWTSEESMFWYTTQKDYATAVLSLDKIAQFNGVVFQDAFREAKDFLRGKRSKAIQCDFQPLLSLEEIAKGHLGKKYEDFDMEELQAMSAKKSAFSPQILSVLTGHHYYPTLSTFYPTDYFHSSIASIYLLVMCGIWLVNALTEFSLDTPHLAQHLTDHVFLNYFYQHLVQLASFLVAFPMVYKWGRRWPTFCFFLIAEVCLLGSVIGKIESEYARVTLLIIYFTGKFAARAAFVVILLYTCEIFPTGLRCTTLGICYMFRLIGMAIASQQIGQFNDWMPRLVYGLLSLVIGALALLLPETKKFPLPRTFVQIETMPTSISKKFRRRRSVLVKKNVRADGTRPPSGTAMNDGASSVSGAHSVRFGPASSLYDPQSTVHSVYELQEYGPDDTLHSNASQRGYRRSDMRNASLFQQQHLHRMNEQQYSIAEDVEYNDEDVDDDRTRIAHHQRRSGGGRQTPVRLEDEVVIPLGAKPVPSSSSGSSGHLEATAQIQSGDVTRAGGLMPLEASTSNETSDSFKKQTTALKNVLPTVTNNNEPYVANLSEEGENYFSEHL